MTEGTLGDSKVGLGRQIWVPLLAVPPPNFDWLTLDESLLLSDPQSPLQ